jgi:hypothetical protein
VENQYRCSGAPPLRFLDLFSVFLTTILNNRRRVRPLYTPEKQRNTSMPAQPMLIARSDKDIFLYPSMANRRGRLPDGQEHHARVAGLDFRGKVIDGRDDETAASDPVKTE